MTKRNYSALIFVCGLLGSLAACTGATDVPTGASEPSKPLGPGDCATGGAPPTGEYAVPAAQSPSVAYAEAVLFTVGDPVPRVDNQKAKVKVHVVLGEVLRNNPNNWSSGQAVDAIAWTHLVEQVDAETKAGNKVYVGIQPTPLGETVEIVDAASFRSSDKSVAFLGDCQKAMSTYVVRLAAERGQDQTALVRDLLQGKPITPTTLAWRDRAPTERQISPETPADVMATLQVARVDVTVPKDWLDDAQMLCLRTDVALGTCTRLSDAVGTVFELRAYYAPSSSNATELVLRGDDGSESTISRFDLKGDGALVISGTRTASGATVDTSGLKSVGRSPASQPTPPTSLPGVPVPVPAAAGT